MTIIEAFESNPYLPKFIQFCIDLNEDISSLDQATNSHIYGLLVLWLSTVNIGISLTNTDIISYFIKSELQNKIDMDCFLFEKQSSFTVINRKPKSEFMEVLIDAITTLKYIQNDDL